MSNQSGTFRPTIVTIGAKVVRDFIQENLQKYEIEGLSIDDARVVIEAHLMHKWSSHNQSTLPEILRQAGRMRAEGGSSCMMEYFDNLSHKKDHVGKELAELIESMCNIIPARHDLSWEQAKEEITTLTSSLETNRRLYYEAAAHDFVESSVYLNVLALPMRSLGNIVNAFRLPEPSEIHVDAAIEIVSSSLDVRSKCDAIIEILGRFQDTHSCLPALLAVDETWIRPEEVSDWFGRQAERQVAQFDRLQAILSGSAYIKKEIHAQAPSGPDLKISFNGLKDMYMKLCGFKETCLRGCRAYDELSGLTMRYVAFIRQQSPMQWASTRPVFAGVLHKCFLRVVDPVRFLADTDYAAQVVQAEEADFVPV